MSWPGAELPLKWNSLNKDREPPLPIDDSDNGWEGPVADGRPQTHQHDAIEIAVGDAIGDSKDIYYLLRQPHIGRSEVMAPRREAE